MLNLKDLEPAYISLYVPFKQVESVAKKLIKDIIGRELPVTVKGEDEYPELRILIEIDDSLLTDDEVVYLSSRGFSADQPYRSAHFVLEEILDGARYEILPRLGHDDEFGTYFLVEIGYEYYID
ncbi:hypothetical protein LCM10_01515 [Rossellomorea aquimaris]|uniref:hypothetical protein n=1 Tax=Rossellomorea aquimaris TaxID=189382 RepID=UPI001CD52031|nr:hypothetical protein [Rossellomorea aquimaris]MCA1053648.1 hypothetical protein [Rossellomorea aquimaris]